MAKKSTKNKKTRKNVKKAINADSSKVKNVALVYKPKPSRKRANKGVSISKINSSKKNEVKNEEIIKNDESVVKTSEVILENVSTNKKSAKQKGTGGTRKSAKVTDKKKNTKNSKRSTPKIVNPKKETDNTFLENGLIPKSSNDQLKDENSHENTYLNKEDIKEEQEEIVETINNDEVISNDIVVSNKEAEYVLDLDVLNRETDLVHNKENDNIEQPIVKEKKKIRWDSVIFTSLLLVFFAVLVLALFRIEVLEHKIIFYICGLLLFLMIIAISYNKYISGKIFTLILCLGMGGAIYRLQYTYDFVHNLNTKEYEYRPYYVIALDTNINKNINNINGKKVGMLKDNNTNVRRVLNTKLDNVNYIFFDDADSLFEAFYKQNVRAIVVGENYYKYLINNEVVSNKNVKVLHEFKANTHK